MSAARFDIARARVLEGVAHGFFGHGGEAHQFGFGGPGEPQAIAQLRSEAAKAIASGGSLVAPHQVHSPDCLAITQPWDDSAEGRPVADALVTATPGLVLGIVTADCAPVLLADRQAGIVGAAHAGWRGAHGGVLDNTLDAMEALGADRARIAAAIGPTIAQPSYEVDARFREQFAPDGAVHFATAPMRDGVLRWHFDLPSYVAARLARAGVSQVEDLALDTLALPQRFYSYRRATLANEPDYGRQISMIAPG